MRSEAIAAQAGSSVFSLTGLFECMRPAQWIKNTFVLAPIVFAARLNDADTLGRELAAAATFCIASSGIYLWNDCMDWRSDLNHPRKKTRPIPSGRLHPAAAAAFGVLLVLLSLIASFSINRPTGMLVSLYVVVNFLYSIWLKHAPILDIMCIAIGFVFRVMAGSTAISVPSSHWLLLCTFLLALFLGIAKRRNEVIVLAGNSASHRRVLAEYPVPWLDQASTLVAGAAVVSYGLYTVAPETIARFGTNHLIYTIPLVIHGILRYLHLMHSNTHTGDPTSALITDKQLLGCVAAWITTCAILIQNVF